MFLDYKPTRYEGKGFLHRDITGDRCGLGWGGNEEVWLKYNEVTEI